MTINLGKVELDALREAIEWERPMSKRVKEWTNLTLHLVFSAAAVILIVLGALTLAGIMGFMTP